MSTCLLVAIILLTGCAHLGKQPTTHARLSWQQRQIALKQIKNWNIDGALSITHNKKRDMARFKWEQKSHLYNIILSGPLNLNRIKIVGSSTQVKLCRSTNNCVRAKTPEQLTAKQLGWQLPISNIRYWILSLPAPKTKITSTSFDQHGHLTTLNQSGWQIRYSEFVTQRDNLELPKLIELANNNLIVKLKIKNCIID